ncbi:hypothetical protein [Brumimicrobium oceani]|nr:hypothetical protein [Brumimicrobium oceani]
MEAWLKFRAPGVNLEIGLSIGQLIFTALNKVEWALAFIVSVALFVRIGQIPSVLILILFFPLVLLIGQTFYLLPELKQQAKHKIEGKLSQKSSIHIYYIIFELIKVITLASAGYMLFKL